MRSSQHLKYGSIRLHNKVSKPNGLSPEIRSYYEETPEAERLRTGGFQLEFERTKELLAERLPGPPATVLDVGGGSGAYALWIAERGYEVQRIVKTDLKEGIHRNETGRFEYFTTAKFHRPDELKQRLWKPASLKSRCLALRGQRGSCLILMIDGGTPAGERIC